MQQKVMKYMMIFMGLMFYKVASGLCLYFIASSLWGLAERKFLPKTAAGDGDGRRRRRTARKSKRWPWSSSQRGRRQASAAEEEPRQTVAEDTSRAAGRSSDAAAGHG